MPKAWVAREERSNYSRGALPRCCVRASKVVQGAYRGFGISSSGTRTFEQHERKDLAFAGRVVQHDTFGVLIRQAMGDACTKGQGPAANTLFLTLVGVCIRYHSAAVATCRTQSHSRPSRPRKSHNLVHRRVLRPMCCLTLSALSLQQLLCVCNV